MKLVHVIYIFCDFSQAQYCYINFHFFYHVFFNPACANEVIGFVTSLRLVPNI